MRISKKNMFFLVPSLLVFMLSGCWVLPEPVGVITLPGPAGGQQTSPHFAKQGKITPSSSVAKRFQQPAQQTQTAVDSAIELSQKYAELSEEAAVLRQKNQSFIAENRHLKNRAAALEAELQQTQKELTEANDLLREMLIELNNWKTDVIGFRGEMREAEKVQLETLLKILKVLGGEVKEKPAEGEDTGSAEISSDKLGQFQPQFHTNPADAGANSGESNG